MGRYLEKENGKMVALQISPKIETKLIARLVLRQKGKIYWPIFQLSELVMEAFCGQNIEFAYIHIMLHIRMLCAINQ